MLFLTESFKEEKRQSMNIQRGNWLSRLLLILVFGVLFCATSIGAQTAAGSSAFGESVSLNVAPILGNVLQVASGPLPQVSGTAAPAYSRTGTLASAAVATGLTGNLLQTGVLTVHASSQMPAAVLTHGDAETDNLALTLGHLIPLLNLGAQVIKSSATIDGTCGSSLVATGTASLANASTGGSVALGLAVPTNPSPNTQLLNLLGIRIILNEQIASGNGTTSKALTVNAIHVYLQNSLLSGLGLLTGDIVISQAVASVQCPAALPAAADLGLTGSATPNPATPGGTLQYNLTVTNQGPNPATGVTLTDTLPAGLTLTSATSGQGTCNPGPPISCALGTVASGQSVPVTLVTTVTAANPGTLVNTVTLTSGVADPNPGNNSVTVATPVTGGGAKSADLSLAGSATPNPVATGGALKYILTVTNHGPDPATGVIVTDPLPAGLAATSATAGQGTCSIGSPVSCNLGTLASGQSVPVTVTAAVTAAQGTLVNTPSLSSSVADPNPGNNSVTVSTPVASSGPGQGADLAIGVSVDLATVQVGHNVTFIFTVTNIGPNSATSVVLTDGAPQRAVIVSLNPSQGSCTVGGQIVCNLGTLASGSLAKVVLVLNPSSASTLLCTGSVTSSVADPNPANNVATASTLVAQPTGSLVDPGACRIDAVPAATLLFPYFEVDLDDPTGATTLISINNAKAAPQLAQVTIWTDWGIPSMSFTVSLTGFAVQTLNLRDIVANGVIPGAGAGGGCPSLAVAGVLPASLVSHLQAWHTGQPSPTLGTCAAPPRASNLATGYITVDAVNYCTSANPTSPGYFVAGGTGVASDENVLWGDFFLVNNDEFQADGDPAVHIRAVPNTFKNHYSFYSSFVAGSGADDRQPLGTSYASRYLSGGLFDGGTHMLIWRDAKVAHPTALACGQEPARMSLAGVVYNETEQAVPLGPSTDMAPWSTQKMQLGGSDTPLPFSFGWIQLDLWHTGSALNGDVAQGWVTTVMSAQKRFSVGLRAIRLDSACDF
jgi:uncharacterized repeat protein (TIGR01451 family)